MMCLTAVCLKSAVASVQQTDLEMTWTYLNLFSRFSGAALMKSENLLDSFGSDNVNVHQCATIGQMGQDMPRHAKTQFLRFACDAMLSGTFWTCAGIGHNRSCWSGNSGNSCICSYPTRIWCCFFELWWGTGPDPIVLPGVLEFLEPLFQRVAKIEMQPKHWNIL